MTGGGELGGIITVRGQTFIYGAFISEVITFVLIAAIVYFVVLVPVKRMMERRRLGLGPKPDESTEVELLSEIRDLLRAEQDRALGRDLSGPGTTRSSGQM